MLPTTRRCTSRLRRQSGRLDRTGATIAFDDALNAQNAGVETFTLNAGMSSDVTFDGSASYDPDGDIVSWEWDFDGDGIVDDTGETQTYAYAASGAFIVNLTVTDDDDVSDSKTTRATITENDENPLLPDAGGEYFGNAGVPVQFNGTGSSPQDGTIESYEWDFGDGQPRGTGPTPSHTYNFRGQYIATLTVTTEDGASASDATDVSIGVGNLPPNADANGPYTGRVG